MRTLLRALRSWWVFLVVERVGYRRPSSVTPEDDALREEMAQRVNLLEDKLVLWDVQGDVLSGRRRHR